ncbi:FecR protein domain-containing protein [Gammaproteobacteria bacterium]
MVKAKILGNPFYSLCQPGLMGLCLVAPLAWGASPPSAEIVSLQGPGEQRERSEAPWHEAFVKQPLYAGNTVRTLDNGSMALLFSDQTQIRLARNSRIEIKKVGDGQQGETLLQLFQGKTWFQSKNVPEQVRIVTPTVTAGIRGTDWVMEVEETGTTTLTVFSGKVEFYNDLGRVMVSRNEQARAEPGQAPAKWLLQNPHERIQWVTAFQANPGRYPELAREPALAGVLNDPARLRQGLATLKTAAAFLLRADFAIADGDYRQAETELSQGAAQFPQDDRFPAHRIHLAILDDRAADARRWLAEASEHWGTTSVELHLVRGELARFEGQALPARTAFLAATGQAPQDPRGWQGLGQVALAQEDLTPARQSLDQALALAPQTPGLRADLAILETFADRLPDADRLFGQALTDTPDDYVAWTGLGILQLKRGEPDKALQSLLKATLLEPRYARAHLYSAVAYYQLGRANTARSELARTTELDPLDPLPYLLTSLIDQDRIEPGASVEAAREALKRMPYLKSLNQLANTQKGSANLGTALAFFGLEEWAESYAQRSYFPFWAGSHLFLADRYPGDFNRKSELFQGFLSDPTVFGSSNRFQDLVMRPGVYGTLTGQWMQGSDMRLQVPTATVNSYANSPFPLATFLQTRYANLAPRQQPVSSDDEDVVAALGANPSHTWGLFAYLHALRSANRTAADDRIDAKSHAWRFDLGARYRPSPTSQSWFKVGLGQTLIDRTDHASSQNTTYQGEDHRHRLYGPESRDLQWRHTWAMSDRHEVTLGAEAAWLNLDDRSSQQSSIHGPGGNPFVLGYQSRGDSRDQSRSLFLSDRFQVSDPLLIQADLALPYYHKDDQIEVQYQQGPPSQDHRTFERHAMTPRLGLAFQAHEGLILRAAWQRWIRPAAFNTLEPVATAGIPLDDRMLLPGGELNRLRGQMEWELSPAFFTSLFAERARVDNLTGPDHKPLNTDLDLSPLDALRLQRLTNVARLDLLEGTPVFSQGRWNSAGVGFDWIASPKLSFYTRYIFTHSENTGAYPGLTLPWLPRHAAGLGLTWIPLAQATLGAQLAYRTERYGDEAHQQPLSAGWEGVVKGTWESRDKHWSLEGFVGNLFKPDADPVVGVTAQWRF